MWAEMALIKKVTEKKVMFKSILSKVSHGAQGFFFGNFGSEIQIGNQQVLGQNWVKKVVIIKFSIEKRQKKDLNLKFKV